MTDSDVMYDMELWADYNIYIYYKKKSRQKYTLYIYAGPKV